MIDMRTAPYATLLLRVTLGIFAIAHLYWKFFVRPDGFDGWWNGLVMAGYPTWVIVYVLSGEFLGALLLIPGIYTRWVALYAFPLIVGAAQFWAVRKGFLRSGRVFSSPEPDPNFRYCGRSGCLCRPDWATAPSRWCPLHPSRSLAVTGAQCPPNRRVKFLSSAACSAQ